MCFWKSCIVSKRFSPLQTTNKIHQSNIEECKCFEMTLIYSLSYFCISKLNSNTNWCEPVLMTFSFNDLRRYKAFFNLNTLKLYYNPSLYWKYRTNLCFNILLCFIKMLQTVYHPNQLFAYKLFLCTDINFIFGKIVELQKVWINVIPNQGILQLNSTYMGLFFAFKNCLFRYLWFINFFVNFEKKKCKNIIIWLWFWCCFSLHESSFSDVRVPEIL